MAKPLASGVSGGVLFAIEPKYGINDHIDLGLRLENAIVARGIVSNNNTVTASDFGNFRSGLLTINCLLGTTNTRPFIGLGAGVYSVASAGTVTVIDGQSPKDVNLAAETKFGGMIRAGLKTGHFVIAAEYNAIPTTTNKLTSITIDSKYAYLGIKLGFDIGGGRL